jgi:hypothetical protein
MLPTLKVISAVSLLSLLLVLAPPALGIGAAPLESPDEQECFEWTYPKNNACGNLNGKTECKAEPSINASDDEKKKADCRPTKGDTCFCE